MSSRSDPSIPHRCWGTARQRPYLFLRIDTPVQRHSSVSSCPLFRSVLALPLSPCLPLLPSLSLHPTNGSRRATVQTAGPVCLLINSINHLAPRELFILKMNYLKVQHKAVSFLLLPHYRSGRLWTHLLHLLPLLLLLLFLLFHPSIPRSFSFPGSARHTVLEGQGGERRIHREFNSGKTRKIFTMASRSKVLPLPSDGHRVVPPPLLKYAIKSRPSDNSLPNPKLISD